MAEGVKRPRGTIDVIPPDSAVYQHIEAVARVLLHSYNYDEIRLPIFERVELFERGVGEATDIVHKEMYVFEDRKGRKLALRPEGTVGVVRAAIENGLLNRPLPLKLYYMGPMFRYERPQAGRYRQHTQIGGEMIGEADPRADAEVILLAYTLYARLGFRDLKVKLNSVGCPECKSNYVDALRDALEPRQDQLCPDCRRRVVENPLRLLDCKVPDCRKLLAEAPPISDHLCDNCREHQDRVEEYLGLVNVPVQPEPQLVRGLDYYTRTVFEIACPLLGAQDALGGGGRYDNLISEIGGPQLPAVGFSTGVERIVLALEQSCIEVPKRVWPSVALIPLNEEARQRLFALVHGLRREACRPEIVYTDRSVGKGLKWADQRGFDWAVIAGEQELQDQRLQLKNLRSGEQVALPWTDGIIPALMQHMRNLC